MADRPLSLTDMLAMTDLSTQPGVTLYAAYEMALPRGRYVAGRDPENPDVEPDVSDVPAPFRPKAQEVADSVDSMSCDVCQSPIGYVLVEDDDAPMRSGLQWRTPWLVLGPSGGVAAACEDCAPYDAPTPKEIP